MSISDGALLAARGAELVFADRVLHVRFDNDGAEKIEEEFKGLDNFIEAIQTWPQRIRTVRRGLQIGLAHEASEEEVVRLLNESPGLLPKAIEAIHKALAQYIGWDLVEVPDVDPKAKGSADSHGDGSTGSRLSVSDVQTPSSGA